MQLHAHISSGMFNSLWFNYFRKLLATLEKLMAHTLKCGHFNMYMRQNTHHESSLLNSSLHSIPHYCFFERIRILIVTNFGYDFGSAVHRMKIDARFDNCTLFQNSSTEKPVIRMFLKIIFFIFKYLIVCTSSPVIRLIYHIDGENGKT